MTYRVRNIGIAVALAAVAALLTSFYVTSYKRHVQRGEDQVTVLVAKHDIAQGTTGADAAHMLRAEQVARRSVVPGAISSRDQEDAGGRAGGAPPLQPRRPERRPGRPEGQPARDADPGRRQPDARRHP